MGEKVEAVVGWFSPQALAVVVDKWNENVAGLGGDGGDGVGASSLSYFFLYIYIKVIVFEIKRNLFSTINTVSFKD
jgi:hypothetical protein